ncbi:MAG: hypothetical protein ACK4F9_05615 [Brevinematia bacterium]
MLKDKIVFLVMDRKIFLMFTFLVVISGCVFRIPLIESSQGDSGENKFDIYPPNVYIVFPQNFSVISNYVTIFGVTEDDSYTITFVKLNYTNFVFTNANNWIVVLNTYEFTNGPIELTFYAIDSLGNKSPNSKFVYYISNSFVFSVYPLGFLITNNSFEFAVNMSSEDYSYLRVYTNSVLVFETNGVSNLIFKIESNHFVEDNTNVIDFLILKSSNYITNTRFFKFDFSPPYFEVLLRSNSYVWGSFNIPIYVSDSNDVLVFLDYGLGTNFYYITNTHDTNFLEFNSLSVLNGDLVLRLWARDVAGNYSSTIELPVKVANYFFEEKNIVSSKTYYFLNSEVVSNRIVLFFTDSGFSSLFCAKEERGFSKEAVKQSSLNILPTGKIRSIVIGNNIVLGYIRDDEKLIIRTNSDSSLTNLYQVTSIDNVHDFDIVLYNDMVKVIRMTTNGILIVADISNVVTNFHTNLSESLDVISEKYSEHCIVYSLYGSNKLLLFTNNNLMFSTNVLEVKRVGIVSFSNGIVHLGVAKNNSVDILVFRDAFTNYSFFTTNYIYHIVGKKYYSNSFWAVVEGDQYGSSYLRLIEIGDFGVTRNQIISLNFRIANLDDFKELDAVCGYSGVKIFVSKYEDNKGAILIFTGL